jgi:hypothetical protein
MAKTVVKTTAKKKKKKRKIQGPHWELDQQPSGFQHSASGNYTTLCIDDDSSDDNSNRIRTCK